MAEIGKTALLPIALAEKPCVRVRRRGVRLVRPLRLAEVRLAVATRVDGGSPEPSFGRKLFIDAQAFSKVPSTEKCSALNSPFTSGRAMQRR